MQNSEIPSEFDNALRQANSYLNSLTSPGEFLVIKRKSFKLFNFFSNFKFSRISVDEKIEQIHEKIDNLKNKKIHDVQVSTDDYSQTQLENVEKIKTKLADNLNKLEAEIIKKKNAIEKLKDKKQIRLEKRKLNEMIKKIDSLIQGYENKNVNLDILNEKIIHLSVNHLINKLERLEYREQSSRQGEIKNFAERIATIIESGDEAKLKIKNLKGIEDEIEKAILNAEINNNRANYLELNQELQELRTNLELALKVKNIPNLLIDEIVQKTIPIPRAEDILTSTGKLKELKNQVEDLKTKFGTVEDCKVHALPNLQEYTVKLLNINDLDKKIEEAAGKFSRADYIRGQIYADLKEKTGINLNRWETSQLTWEECLNLLEHRDHLNPLQFPALAMKLDLEKQKSENLAKLEIAFQGHRKKLNDHLENEPWLSENNREALQNHLQNSFNEIKKIDLGSPFFQEKLENFNRHWNDPASFVSQKIPDLLIQQVSQLQTEAIQQLDQISNATLRAVIKEGLLKKFESHLNELKDESKSIETKKELYSKLIQETKEAPLMEARDYLRLYVEGWKTTISKHQEKIEEDYHLNPEEKELMQKEIEGIIYNSLEENLKKIETMSLDQLNDLLQDINRTIKFTAETPEQLFENLSDSFKLKIAKKKLPESKQEKVDSFKDLAAAKKEVLEERKQEFLLNIEKQIQERKKLIEDKFLEIMNQATGGMWFETDSHLKKIKEEGLKELQESFNLQNFEALKKQLAEIKSEKKLQQFTKDFNINKLSLYPKISEILRERMGLIVNREYEIYQTQINLVIQTIESDFEIQFNKISEGRKDENLKVKYNNFKRKLHEIINRELEIEKYPLLEDNHSKFQFINKNLNNIKQIHSDIYLEAELIFNSNFK